MGLMILFCIAVFFTHSGICWEKRKHVVLTKNSLTALAAAEFLIGIYFVVTAFGHYSK
tara:strand:+ start:1966 stop:2139 length:174 start_codon:yes stop_codon:yes gene_type:complete